MAEKTQVLYNRNFGGFLFVYNIKKQTNLETKTCTLIWDTNPRSSPSFSLIGQRTAEKFVISVRPANRQTDRLRITGGR
jgi:hypothetical protein